MPSALPRLNPSQVNDENPDYLSAYNVCLEHQDKVRDHADNLRHIRILGFLLLNAPRDVRSEVSNSIHSCKGETDHLIGLGWFFEKYIILPFKKSRGNRTPIPSEHSSRSSFETTKTTKIDITQAPKNHQDAKFQALLRDNWRCVVTGLLNATVPDDCKIEDDEAGVYTECAHIIPEATFFNADPKSEDNTKFDYSASILAILRQFRVDISGLNREKVHSLTNVMTMEHNVHDYFDSLELYFEATVEKDHYEIKGFGRMPPLVRKSVTFSTPDAEHLPVPSPDLLAFHATCCKVAHLSGASEYIDKVWADANEAGVLAADGSSGDILRYLLASLSTNPVNVRR